MGHDVRKELRVRSGCRKCRERRVKCPEQRPICYHCQRLGFICKYELCLSWQSSLTYNSVKKARHGRNDSPAQGPVLPWMFINMTCGDFSETKSHKAGVLPQSRTSTLEFRNISSEDTDAYDSAQSQNLGTPSLRHLSPYHLSETDAYLWEYFDKSITPQCVLDQSANPYRNIILRLATFFQEGPLFHCVLAVAANQLNSLGRTEYLPAMWSHRAHALRGLRGTVGNLWTSETYRKEPYEDRNGDQTVACALMLCFFDISQDCSESWTVHSSFIASFLFSRYRSERTLNVEQEALQDFAVTYVVSHDILASTASPTKLSNCATADKLCEFANPESLQTLTGFSKDLLILISDVNLLASMSDDLTTFRGQLLSDDRKRRRDDIERCLHCPQKTIPSGMISLNEENHSISEAKRLAALMYLYARLDRASPHEPCMVKLTSEILSIIPNISLRTNTVLWPLFITATLGIRPESDKDRKVVLGRLEALQNTRQLGNVKMARQVIESVWKARDLKDSKHGLGWDILQGCHQTTISLA